MKLLLFVILAGYAVKCDDSNYYVIQMPDDDPPKEFKKPFRVYWNVPTMQCKSKKIPFLNLYDKFGIIQNKNDTFRGEKIAILYDPGVFPALLKNDTSGKYTFRNGGVPQEGDLEKHTTSFRKVLDQSVPDPDFNGVGIIDFESWRPVFRQNFGVLTPYKDVSYQIERSNHWLWPQSWIKEEAKRRFEKSARTFMQNTISVAKEMRPKALWGYYGFPYCFNMASNNMAQHCADKVPAENDRINWLWTVSSALYPSLYSSRELSTWQVSQLVRGRVSEAARLRRGGSPILPYFWFRYRDGGYFSEEDLQAVLKTLYKSEASGLIIWGASADVNTVEKCEKLLNYVENVLGPAIAKYTKGKLHDELDTGTEDEANNTVSVTDHNSTTTTTTTVDPIINATSDNIVTVKPLFDKKQENTTTTKAPLRNIEPDLADPEFEWNPPVNYTQDIKKYVEEEFNKKTDNDISQTDKNKTVIHNLSDNVLMDLIISTFTEDVNKNESNLNITKNETGKDKNDETELLQEIEGILVGTSAVESTENYEIETSTPTYIDSQSIYKITTDDEGYTEYTTENYDQHTTGNEESNVLFNEESFFEDATFKLESKSAEFVEVDESITTEKPSKDKKKGIPKEVTLKQNATKGEEAVTTTENILDYKDSSATSTNLVEVTTKSTEFYSKNRRKGIPKSTTASLKLEAMEPTSDSLITRPTQEQVAASAYRSSPKYYFCIFFYFYSVSKCLCDYYAQCT